MIALARLVLAVLVAATIVYWCVRRYALARRRDRLVEEWAARPTGSCEAHVRRGLEAYEGLLRRRLVLMIYVLPLGLLLLHVVVTNA